LLTKAFAVFLALHGIVHWIGFAVPWRLMTMNKHVPYDTTILWGNIDLGDTGVRLEGLLWLPAIALFVAAAYAIWLGRSWAIPIVAVAAAFSLVICALNLPDAQIGAAIDVALLAGIVAVRVLGIRLPGTAGPALRG
jgi:hypothetical protein